MSREQLRDTSPALFDDAVALLSERHGYAFLATTARDGSPSRVAWAAERG